jgi:hypothetical protein
MGSMREHLSWDVLKPRTKWYWAEGPSEVRLPGGSLAALADALVAADGAMLSYAGLGYVLGWSDLPSRQEDEDAVRQFTLTCRHPNRAGLHAGDHEAPPGPFAKVAPLRRDNQTADLSASDRMHMRDAIWRLLDEAGESLDATG